MHSTWQSVAEQTGIFAGKGGFDVTVGEHTQLNGAVISSTATADKNRLDTGTLGFGDIENHADYKVEHQSAGMSTGGSVGGQFAGNMANGMLAGLNDNGTAAARRAPQHHEVGGERRHYRYPRHIEAGAGRCRFKPRRGEREFGAGRHLRQGEGAEPAERGAADRRNRVAGGGYCQNVGADSGTEGAAGSENPSGRAGAAGQ